jgi:malonyl-CoA O-methyltransferase
MSAPVGTEDGLEDSAIRKSFDAASRTYDRAAVLQTEVRARLLERMQIVKLEPEVILDLGAGTGHASRALKSMFPKAHVIALDVAFGMLEEARHQQGLLRRFSRVVADGRKLPLRSQSVGLVFSNLMVQWCDPPDPVFAEVQRVLKPHGLFTFTTFGPDTLKELRAAWRAVDDHTHVNRFTDMHDVGDALMRAHFAEPVLDVEPFTLTYADAYGLMRELKAIGAHNVSRGRRPGLTGRGAIQLMASAYESFRRDGKLPATYEVVYGHAWGPVQRLSATRGETAIPLSAIGRKPR